MTKVMVVDDDAGVLTLVRLALEEEGFEVIEASDASECLKMLRYVKPDLILLDVMMPGINGWKVCKLIKENERLRNIPVCMLTVLSEEVDKRTSLDLALADYHISKPFNKKKLLEVVNRLVGKK